MRLIAAALFALSAGACNTAVFVVDGVTDGDTFHLAERAMTNDDPVLQSWVAYSLAKSVCQLDVGGENPARVSTYGCEYTARSTLVDTWREHRAESALLSDPYLDDLIVVSDAGYLDEYVVHYFGRRQWQVPAEVDSASFRNWRRQHLRGHRKETRIIGSWSYRPPMRNIPAGEH